MTSESVCPFCAYAPPAGLRPNDESYNLAHHIEISHRETGQGRSPFEITSAWSPTTTDTVPSVDKQSGERPWSARSSTTSGSEKEPIGADDVTYIDCPRKCGEKISQEMLKQHLDLHQDEDVASDELEGQYDSSTSRRHRDAQMDRDERKHSSEYNENHRKPKSHRVLRNVFSVSSALDKVQRNRRAPKPGQRLGRKELGPHAYEEKMPPWLLKQLKDGPPVTWANQIGPDGKVQRVERVANETQGLVPALARLCNQDRSVSKAWLCAPGGKHVFKMRREGGFCGYRNIQMQASWMQHHQHPGYEHFGTGTPNILDLQVIIEDAWAHGFNSSGKAETGGIIGTRKYIGTPEAQAMFQFLGIPCQAAAFTKSKLPDSKDPVYTTLLMYVLEYFSKGVRDASQKVYVTDLPPIYFQHPGHSLTIVGIEVHKDRDIDLLVFDPTFPTVPAMMRYLGSPTATSNPGKILKAFRRGCDYLGKFKSFEVLSLADGPSAAVEESTPTDSV